MKTKINFLNISIILLAIVSLGLVGCETRSISNAGYQAGGYYSSGRNPLYHGELSEFDVLGTGRDQTISEEEIGKALDNALQVQIKRGSSILLVQSGAAFPDETMMQELRKSVSVTPFSGQPQPTPKAEAEKTSYSKSIRMTAAKGGFQTIICYWGILESARDIEASKTVSWIPIVGWSIPDETQRMRIKLKFAVINVRTGNWSLFAPEPLEQKALSAIYTRAQSDQRQVDVLKKAAYEAAARDLMKNLSN